MQIFPIIFISLILGFIGLIIISRLLQLSTNVLFLGIFGTIVGLLIGALASVPLSKLPGDYGIWIPIVITVISVFGTLILFLSKKHLIIAGFEGMSRIFKFVTSLSPKSHSESFPRELILDTSAIIDGRIADIIKTGFLPGNLIVPRFVLKELQTISDSDLALKREKGRRGLELLNNLKKKSKNKVKIIDNDFPEIKEVDSKLVKLAKKRGGSLVTVDYNLNKIAKVEGVGVLNVNELVNAVKTAIIPGEELNLKIIQAGKEKTQGVGYLPDGTMIVVEGGDKFLGQEIIVQIKRIFQTDAGKMFFAEPIEPKEKKTFVKKPA
ncbi:MAG: PIN domain nuclease [Patescibacteria group bacterium]|nr:PIN domain nuclease [Patescibacteria group bacterium]